MHIFNKNIHLFLHQTNKIGIHHKKNSNKKLQINYYSRLTYKILYLNRKTSSLFTSFPLSSFHASNNFKTNSNFEKGSRLPARTNFKLYLEVQFKLLNNSNQSDQTRCFKGVSHSGFLVPRIVSDRACLIEISSGNPEKQPPQVSTQRIN